MTASQASAQPEFAGRTAIVTGGGTGIGRATALLLARHGADVVIASRSPERLREAAEEIAELTGRKALALATDVREDDQITRLVDTTIAAFGRLDIVVNNAGGTYLRPIDQQTRADWDRILSLNLTSVFGLTRAAVPYLEVHGGSIINISSSSASSGTLGGSAYSAAKSGVEMFTKVAAAELSPRGIRVNCVAPGMIRSQFAERSWERGGLDVAATEARLPLRRLGFPHDIAKIIKFLASDDAGYLTGEVIHADGGPQMDGLDVFT